MSRRNRCPWTSNKKRWVGDTHFKPGRKTYGSLGIVHPWALYYISFTFHLHWALYYISNITWHGGHIYWRLFSLWQLLDLLHLACQHKAAPAATAVNVAMGRSVHGTWWQWTHGLYLLFDNLLAVGVLYFGMWHARLDGDLNFDSVTSSEAHIFVVWVSDG